MLAVIGEFSMMSRLQRDGPNDEEEALIEDLRGPAVAGSGGEDVPFLRTVRRPGLGDGGRVKMLCCPKACEGSAEEVSMEEGLLGFGASGGSNVRSIPSGTGIGLWMVGEGEGLAAVTRTRGQQFGWYRGRSSPTGCCRDEQGKGGQVAGWLYREEGEMQVCRARVVLIRNSCGGTDAMTSDCQICGSVVDQIEGRSCARSTIRSEEIWRWWWW